MKNCPGHLCLQLLGLCVHAINLFSLVGLSHVNFLVQPEDLKGREEGFLPITENGPYICTRHFHSYPTTLKSVFWLWPTTKAGKSIRFWLFPSHQQFGTRFVCYILALILIRLTSCLLQWNLKFVAGLPELCKNKDYLSNSSSKLMMSRDVVLFSCGRNKAPPELCSWPTHTKQSCSVPWIKGKGSGGQDKKCRLQPDSHVPKNSIACKKGITFWKQPAETNNDKEPHSK